MTAGTALGVLAAFGLFDVLRLVPGPQVPLALPLREPGGADGVSALVVFGVPLLLAALAAVAVPPRRRLAGALGRAAVVLAVTLVAQGITIQLVRQAVLGVALTPALASASPWLMAGATLVGTLVSRALPQGRTAA
jgi:hypothetical protein